MRAPSAFRSALRMLRGRPALIGLGTLASACLAACGGMQMHKPEQGLHGAFSTYGPPAHVADCNPLVTQYSKDSCRHENERVIEDPYQGSFQVRNLTTRETRTVELDPQGNYKVELDPGEYEVCVGDECGDPLEVRMGVYSIYGQRLPRAAVDTAKASRPAKADVSDLP